MNLFEPIYTFVNNTFQSIEFCIFLLLSFRHFIFDGGCFLFLIAMNAGKRRSKRTAEHIVYNEDDDFVEPINVE